MDDRHRPHPADDRPTLAPLPAPGVDPEARTIDTSGPATRAAESDLTIGDQVGPYRLIERIGEGGFGEVWRAEQREPIARQVAVKVVKLGMDTRQVVARFETERQALALMDHPGIARVFDAGVTGRGRPYFVMELVRGVPITEYADKQNLSTRDRLDLFMDVCRAVQHAHQKGVIHRDIKPSNVLVHMIDAKPACKVIDFGIAKAIHGPLTERTMYTQQRQMIGTPEYMSPEQAEMNGLDVDTRTDIYSLGVLLYELLTGQTPFTTERMDMVSRDDLTRLIRETEAPRPSLRLRTMGDGADAVARRHRSTAQQLRRDLTGDLDWIVLRSIEKDRTRRYESADALAADVRRHLDDEPVLAGPPTASYRLSKFIRRNKAGIASVGLVALALVAGTVTTSWGFVRASAQRNQAVLARNEEALARQAADAARAESVAVTEFLTGMLSAADPGEGGRDMRVRDVLDRAAADLGSRFEESPRVRARLRETIGETYLALGIYDSADRQLESAADALERETGPTSPEAIGAREALARLRHRQGRYAEARSILESLVLPESGSSASDRAVAQRTLAQVAEAESRFDEAEGLYNSAIDTLSQTLGAEDRRTLSTRTELAHLLSRRGRYGEAEALHRSTQEAQRRLLGPEHPDTLASGSDLAWVVFQAGRAEEAAASLRAVLSASERVLGPEHPETLERVARLAQTLTAAGRPAEAAAALARVVDIRTARLGADHPETLSGMSSLAMALRDAGQTADAEALFDRTLAAQRRVLGAEHEGTIATAANLANLYQRTGRPQEAADLLAEIIPAQERAQGPEHPTTLALLVTRAGLLSALGKPAQAEPIFRDAIARIDATLGEDHPYAVAAAVNLGLMLRQQERYADAQPLYERALRSMDRTLGADHPNRLRTAANLAELRRLRGDLAGAWSTLGDALQRAAVTLGESDPVTRLCLGTLEKLAADRVASGDRAAAARLLREARGMLPEGSEARAQIEAAAEALVDAAAGG